MSIDRPYGWVIIAMAMGECSAYSSLQADSRVKFAAWRWPTLAQMNHSEPSHMAGAVDDSTINIVVVIIIIIIPQPQTHHRRRFRRLDLGAFGSIAPTYYFKVKCHPVHISYCDHSFGFGHDRIWTRNGVWDGNAGGSVTRGVLGTGFMPYSDWQHNNNNNNNI